MFRIISRATAAIALMAALGACYITGASVIPAERAEAIPGIEGAWLPADNSTTDTLNVAQKPGSKDYALTSSAPDAQGQTLTARGYLLAGSTYVVQMWDEASLQDGVVLVFLTIDGDDISILGVTSDQQALASQAGVTLAEDNVTLDGDAGLLLNFIELHKNAQFTPPTPMLKRVS